MPAAIQLVKDGRALFRIVPFPPQDEETFRGPMTELVRHLEAAIGADVCREEKAGAEIRLSLVPHERMGRERYRIETERGRITLRASAVQGLYHAVYRFLETAFGIRWLWPGETGTVIPRARNIAWREDTIDESPAFRWRFFGTTGCVWERYDPDFAGRAFIGIPEASQDAFRAWARRVRAGGLHLADGHRWAQFCSPEEFGKTHPEYFALIGGKRDCRPGDGKHGNQPCTTNPDVINMVAERISAQFDARPELDGYSLAVNDGSGFCECPECKKVDAWAGEALHKENEVDAGANETPDAPGGGAGQTVITDRIFKFANDVMEKIEESHPGKLLIILVYSAYRQPPRRVRLHRNIIAQFCTPAPAFVMDDFFDAEAETLGALNRYAQKIGIYDYFEFGWRGGVPLAFPDTAAKAIKMYYRRGARYFATQTGYGFALGGLHYYVASRLLWDPRQRTASIVRDFCESGFGNAAATVRKYFESFETRWKRLRCRREDLPRAPELFLPLLYPAEFILQRRRDLETAHARAAGDAASLERIGHLERGLEFADAFARAMEAFLDVEQLGISFSGNLEDNRRQLEHACQSNADALRQAMGTAYRAADRLLNLARRECGDFVYSEWWFHYFLQKRSRKFRRFLALRGWYLETFDSNSAER